MSTNKQQSDQCSFGAGGYDLDSTVVAQPFHVDIQTDCYFLSHTGVSVNALHCAEQ